ncbi:MAG: SIS domain-containing protein [Candidatus Saliniplasma sp.]
MGEVFIESIDYILKSISKSLDSVSDLDLKKASEIIINSEQVFVYGAGRSGLVGRTFAMRLMQIGFTAFFIGETITPSVNSNDCAIFISKTGETQTAIQAAKIIKDRVGAETILLTASPESTLAGYSDEIITLDIVRTDKDKTLAPLGTIFENSAMIFLDAFIAELMDKIGETEEGMEIRHPILV